MSLEEIGIALLSWCVRAVMTGMTLSVGVYLGLMLYLRKYRAHHQPDGAKQHTLEPTVFDDFCTERS